MGKIAAWRSCECTPGGYVKAEEKEQVRLILSLTLRKGCARRAVMSRILDLGQRLLAGADYGINRVGYGGRFSVALQTKVGS